jgi:hypothetical protein
MPIACPFLMEALFYKFTEGYSRTQHLFLKVCALICEHSFGTK